MKGKLEKVESKLNEMSDELDEWAERTGAKVESDGAAIAHHVEAVKGKTDEHLAAARKRVTTAGAAKRATAKAKFHEVATKAAEGADEGKAKHII